MKTLSKLLFLVVYYLFAYWLPNSYLPIIGRISNRIRIICVKIIFQKCGNIRTINRKVYFGFGSKVIMGNESGIGANTTITDDVQIGNNVIISRDVFILARNHAYENTEIPINDQGYKECKQIIIEDDVWIGLRCVLTPGRYVKKGSIIAMGSVLTKDFPEYSIVGGNPAKLIKMRK